MAHPPSCDRVRRRTLNMPFPTERHRRLRSGFTLAEMLTVVVVIGLLAAILIPKFGTSKKNASYASVKADLHNLVTMQESFFYDYHRYTNDFDSLKFAPSRGVVVTVEEANAGGWSAKAYHPDSWPRMCAIFFGTAAPVAPATASGALECTK